MKQEFKPMTWIVKNFDANAQKITDYDVLKYREDQIKKLKKKCATKEEFAEELWRELQWRFWSRAEYELIIKLTEDGRVILSPWVGCRNPEEVEIDVTEEVTYDWKGFAEKHISKQIYKDEAKIDIFSQLTYGDNWEKLITYLWTTRWKWERDHPKFHE